MCLSNDGIDEHMVWYLSLMNFHFMTFDGLVMLN